MAASPWRLDVVLQYLGHPEVRDVSQSSQDMELTVEKYLWRLSDLL